MRREHKQVLGEHQPKLHAFGSSADAYALGGASKTGVLVTGEGEAPLEHLGSVEVVAFGSRWLATGSRDMGVRFFTHEGALHQLAKGHYNRITALCWLDADTLISASVDGRVAIFRSDEPRMVRSVVLPRMPRALALSDAGILVGTDAAIHLLSPALEIIETIASHPVRALCAAGSRFAALHRDLESKTDCVSVYEGATLLWSGPGTAIAIHEAQVAIGTLEGRLLVRTANELLFEAAPHDSELVTICATAHGWLTGGRDGLAQLTSYSGDALGGVRHRAALAQCGTLGDDLVTVSCDAEVAIWRPGDATELARPRRLEPSRTMDLVSGAALAFGDGSLFGVSTSEGFHVFDRHDASLHEVIEPSVPHWYAVHGSGVWGTRIGSDRTLALMRSGGTIAKLDGFYAPQIIGSCVLTDALECHRLDDDGVESLVRTEGNIHGCAIAPSGRWAWLAGNEASICVDVRDGEQWRFPPCGKASFSHDDSLVAYTTDDTVVLHDVRNGRTMHRLPITRVWTLRWSPVAQRIAIGTSERVVYVVDARTGRVETTLAASEPGTRGYNDPVWLPGGERIAVGANWLQGALFERDGSRVATFEGINSGFISCRVVGDRILVWSNVLPNPDLTLQLWTFDGELVAQLPGHQGEKFWQVNPSACGRWIATLVDGDSVRVWSTEDGSCSILPVRDAIGAEVRDDACVTVERQGRICVFEL